MNAEANPPGKLAAACALPGNCPLCGQPNGCRVEAGEAYKGLCWCERLTVPAAALRRLLEDVLEPRCVCAGCLESIATDPEISIEALLTLRLASKDVPPLAPVEGDFYWEGAAMVFTEQYHLRRGACCGSGCRHCPYGSRRAPRL